jgi:hypothetical protein
MNLRKYNFSKWHNSVFTDFAGVRANIDGTSVPNVRYNIFFGHTADGTGYGTANCPAADNPAIDPLLRSIDRGNNNLLDPRVADLSPAYTGAGTPPVDGFFVPTSYKGAFTSNVWILSWTAMDNNAHMGYGIAATPKQVVVAAPVAPILSIVPNGANVDISFLTQTGFGYQLQTNALLPGVWGSSGLAIPGTGSPVIISQPITGDEQYFRVLAQ